MKVLMYSIVLVIAHLQVVCMAAIETDDGKTFLHFDYKTENGHQRVEDIMFDSKIVAAKSVEHLKESDEVTMTPVTFRGGYSFISADGYEYTVKYKANKNGFQPYVTAHKLTNPPAVA